jgi:hypothetical protein
MHPTGGDRPPPCHEALTAADDTDGSGFVSGFRPSSGSPAHPGPATDAETPTTAPPVMRTLKATMIRAATSICARCFPLGRISSPAMVAGGTTTGLRQRRARVNPGGLPPELRLPGRLRGRSLACSRFSPSRLVDHLDDEGPGDTVDGGDRGDRLTGGAIEYGPARGGVRT